MFLGNIRRTPLLRFAARLLFFGLNILIFIAMLHAILSSYAVPRTLSTTLPMTLSTKAAVQDESLNFQPIAAACLTEAEFSEQQANEAKGLGLGPPSKTVKPEAPRLPWKHWNWCSPRSADFTYSLQERGFCANKTVEVLRIVVSGLTAGAGREKMRKVETSRNIQTLFVLGTSPEKDQLVQEKLQSESDKYHDILQPDVIATHENGSLLFLGALHWAVTHCAHAKMIYRTGDYKDSVVEKVVKIVEREEKEPSAAGVIHCHQLSAALARVMRKDDHPAGAKPHWLASYTDYPEEYFPQYCLGSYAFKVSMGKRLLEMWTWSRYFKLEGVYVTGILPLMMGNAARVQM